MLLTKSPQAGLQSTQEASTVCSLISQCYLLCRLSSIFRLSVDGRFYPKQGILGCRSSLINMTIVFKHDI